MHFALKSAQDNGGEARAVLTRRGAQRAREGHLWIYKSDVAEIANAASGDIVPIFDRNDNFIARAHYGAESEISLRLLSFSEQPIDREFWQVRLRAAMAWRKKVVRESDCYRLVHSEGDLLPGLVIDCYGDSVVIQTLTRGMDLVKSMWVEMLVEALSPRLIVERNDVKVRALEGLPQTVSTLYSASSDDKEAAGEVEVTENGLRFVIDLRSGQKTGAFLDQRENRAAARSYARGRGLDCFTFHGSFALHLAANCESVTAIDISAQALERARNAAVLNGIENIEFLEGNVFDELHRFDNEGRRFETIVLDPPAFAKNRRAIDAAARGYKEINLRALKLLEPGGILMTCSCSYHMSEAMFVDTIAEAARDAGRQIQIVEKRTQSRDHPVLLTVPETCYLKCLVLRVIR